ncbi:MAG: hypothetical protein HQK83_19315, partial [Fibrobacteria bacterium]|nr:hypothetical protein [Fibrobacteria bacterium]
GAWYNMGSVDKELLMNEYHRALRLAYLSCRKWHSDLQIYISMDHHWNSVYQNDNGHALKGTDLVEGINQRAKEGGDFEWHIAHHPYPADLFYPTWWQDGTPTFSFDSPLMTLKNYEVMPVYLAQQHLLYKGNTRNIDISEMGFHTPGEATGEEVQAAAWTCAFHKVKHMPEIGMYIYHSHITSKKEAPLDMGLWTSDQPPRKKQIWDVFRQTETDTWESAFEFAKPILGIESWDECLPDYDKVIK